MRRTAATVGLGLVLVASPALAHPHIWIEVTSTVVAEADSLVGVRHDWTFDPMFSAFEVEGLARDGDGRILPEALAGVAERYAGALPPWGYFTEIRLQSGTAPALVARPLQLTHDGSRLTLHLDLDVEPPVPLASLDQVRVHDGTFFVSLTYPQEPGPVRLEGAEGCAVLLHRPGQLDPALLARLGTIPASQRELPADLAAKVRDAANRIELDCTGR